MSDVAGDDRDGRARGEQLRDAWRLIVARLQAMRAAVSRGSARVMARPGVPLALRIAGTVVALAITTAVFLILNRQFLYNGRGYDEEFFIWGGWCIRKGLVPYRDFIEFKPPMVFLTHALAQALFGLEGGGFRMYFTVFPLAAVLTFHGALMARGIGRMLATGSVVAFLSLFMTFRTHDVALTDSESIGLCYYLLGLAFFLWEGRHSKVTTAIGGVFMSLCVMSKEPFLPIVAASWLGMFWLRGGAKPTRASASLFARFSLLGVGLTATALCLYMVVTGALGPYLAMAGRYARMYRDPKLSYCVVLGLAHPSTPWPTFVETWTRMRRAFLNEGMLGYLVPFVIPGLLFAWRRSRPLLLCMFAATLAALWAPTASNCMWWHYYNMSMAGIVFLFAAGLDSMERALVAADRKLRAGVGIAALLVAFLHAGPDLWKQRNAPTERPPLREPQPGLLAFIKANTTPSDRILTDGTPFLYAIADRVAGVRESNFTDEILGFYEGATDEEKLQPLREQLRRSRPKVVFLDPEHARRKQRHHRALIMPFLAELGYRKVNPNLYVLP